MKRVILGQRNAGEFGLWVSKPGVDAMSNTDDDFLVAPSKLLTKLVMTGTVANGAVQTTTAGSQGSAPTKTGYYMATIAHNLGFVPVVLVFGQDSAGYGLGSGVDATNLYVIGTTRAFSGAQYAVFNWPLVVS